MSLALMNRVRSSATQLTIWLPHIHVFSRDETAVATDARTSGSESETAAGADEGGREVSPAPAFTE